MAALAESTEGGFLEAVDTYAAQQRIAHVHLRNVRGQVPNDNETCGV